MKQLSIAAILFLSISLRSFAGDPSDKLPNFKGAENFRSTFPQAVIINYKNAGDLTEVNFTWQGLRIAAFYDKDGTQVATSRTVTAENLPINVQLNLKHQYPGYTPLDAIEYEDIDNNLSYYVTVADQKATYVLRFSQDCSLSVYKRLSADKKLSKN
jgi:hypothetical protein